MFIVILSVVSIVLEELDADDFIPVNPTIVRTMRVLRIARGKGKSLISCLL